MTKSFTLPVLALAWQATTLPLMSQERSSSPLQEGAAKPAQCWEISDGNEISLLMGKEGVLPYKDNIEMSGKRVSGIISYAIDTEGNVAIEREIFFPQLHQFKSSVDTWYHDFRAYLQETYSDDLLPTIYIGDEEFVAGPVSKVSIDGVLNFEHKPSKNGLALSRSFYPSTDERLFLENWTLENTTEEALTVRGGNTTLRFEDYGARGKFTRIVASNMPESSELQPGESVSFSLKIAATIEGEEWPSGSAESELDKRREFLAKMADSLQLETPDPVLNTLFEFSKMRASDSIFESELGLIHSPGGGRYYVGIWANDQAEYINPFFALLGYEEGNDSAMNCFRAFAKETNPEYKPVRYSFEIEGLVRAFDSDRGDAAMIAYGAAQYALTLGDKEIAEELWPLIEWCLEFCHRKRNAEGVVMSDTDEMENRIEAGDANLSTSSLYYGALDHAIDLATSLGKDATQIESYEKQMEELAVAIDSFFGATVEGLETYKYYKEHKFLRHWICLPLVVGIHDRKEATIEGLFERLWTDNGVHVEKNSDSEKITKIFWDRGTLYALRGTFIAGATETSLAKLQQFSNKRLLGDRVPFVVEAYPEGDMAHLSAESALYCRVFTEGLFGFQPTGLSQFELTPRLPDGWDKMALRKVRAFQDSFDVEVNRLADGKLKVTISKEGEELTSDEIEAGESFKYELK